MRVTLIAESGSIGSIRHAATAFARAQGAIDGTVADIALAVTEAVSNVVVHAYRDRVTPGSVTVRGDRVDHELRFIVTDDGKGVVPRADSPGLGLGLAIIGRLARTLEIRAGAAGGAEICMTFGLVPGD